MRTFTAMIMCTFLLTISPCQSSAQQVPYRLDDIIVTASRIPTPLVEAPANVSIITKEDIEEMGATTLIDIFKREPGVFTSNLLNNPKFSAVDIRGYGETASQNVLFLVDGRRINSIDLSGTDLAQIPIDIIERVEIYRGPATVLYGDNAVAGAINIVTKKGEGKPTIKAGIITGSHNLYAPTLSILGKEGKFSYYALSSSYDSDGYRHNNSLRMKDLFGSFTFDAFRNLSVSLKAGHHIDRYGLPGALSQSDLNTGRYDRKDSKTPFDNSSTEDNFVDLGTDVRLGNHVTLSIYGSYRNRHSSFHYGISSPFDSKRVFETYGFTPKLLVDIPLWGMKNTLVTGFDYYNFPTSSSDFGPPYTNSITRIEKTDGAFYINDEFLPLKDLMLGFGYRIQKSSYQIDYTDNLGFLSPTDSSVRRENDAFRATANYLLGKKGSVFVTWAKGFRMPTTDELFSPYSSPPINQNLKPQVTKEIDAGIRYSLAEWLGGSLTYFQARTDNEIYYNPLTYTNGNYDKTKRDGVEATIYIAFLKELNLDILYSYTGAKFDGGAFGGNRVPHVPKNKFSTKLTYTWKGLTAGAILSYLGSRYLISDQLNQLPKLPGVTLLDLNAKYTFKGVQAHFSVKNVMGKKYSEYGVASYPFMMPPTSNFYPSAERQFLCGFSYTF